MFTSLIDICEKNNIVMYPKEYESFEKEIVSIFNGNLEVDLNNSILTCCLGNYYYLEKDYENMLKYYLISINLGNSFAMTDLGYYYQEKKDYENMLKYYLTAIDIGNSFAMTNLARFYQSQKDYDIMKEYYLMAIDLDNIHAMVYLANYYHRMKKYDKMIQYYLMAIEKGSVHSMNNLAFYYEHVEDYDKMMVYYQMAIKKGCPSAMNNLASYYQKIRDYDKMMVYYQMAIESGNSLAMYNLGDYYQMKNDYENMVKYNFMYLALDVRKILPEKSRSIMHNLLRIFSKLELFKRMFDFSKNNSVSTYFLKQLKKLSSESYIQLYLKEKYKNTRKNKMLSFLYYTYVINNIESQDNYKTDFKIIAKLENSFTEYYISSTVLSSKYFEILIYGNFKKTTEITIEVEHIKTIPILIKYLYLQEIEENVEKEVFKELIQLSDEYQLEDFKDACEAIKYIIN